MIDGKVLLARLRALAPEQRRSALVAAGDLAVREIDGNWASWARPGQRPTSDDWHVWVIMAGRGFGKTRAGAEWVSEKARACAEARIGLVAANPEEARRVMVEGRGGLFAAARDGEERRLMRWEPGIGRLTFASGAQAFVYSGADGESLRGAELHFAWCDELAKWRRAEKTWDNLMLALRAGTRPQAVVTTTPRSGAALERVLAMANVVVTGGRSRDNPFVATAAIEALEREHKGTRWGRQELNGELIGDVAGALWTRELIERSRVTARGPLHQASHGPPPRSGEDFKRVVVGVDPPVTADGDECGIVVCALAEDPGSSPGQAIGYVLADASAGGLSPERWAARVAHVAETWTADRVVAEGNQGGEMVEAVLRGAGVRLPVRRVHARRGKVRRAEPVAALFERGEAKLAGRFPELEDQLAGLVLGGGYEKRGSPDRADAMVWALTELMLGKPPPAEPRIRLL